MKNVIYMYFISQIRRVILHKVKGLLLNKCVLKKKIFFIRLFQKTFSKSLKKILKNCFLKKYFFKIAYSKNTF